MDREGWASSGGRSGRAALAQAQGQTLLDQPGKGETLTGGPDLGFRQKVIVEIERYAQGLNPCRHLHPGDAGSWRLRKRLPAFSKGHQRWLSDAKTQVQPQSNQNLQKVPEDTLALAYFTLEAGVANDPKMRKRLSIAPAALLATCLAASAPAKALEFTFSFVGDGNKSVSGIIRGLQNGQTTNPATVEVTSSSIAGLQGLYAYFNIGNGFTVANGAITDADWVGRRIGSPTSSVIDFLFNGAALSSSGSVVDTVSCSGSFCPVVFTPYATAPVPGPLPVVGAAAAFGISRRLRKRINAS